MVEVERPEGFILSALCGTPHSMGDDAIDFSSRTINEAKDRVEAEETPERLRALEEQERGELTKWFRPAPAKNEGQPLVRAPRLCRLLLERIEKNDGETERRLYEELLRREQGVLLFGSPDGKGVMPRSFPGVPETALPAYPDLRSLQWCAQDLGMAPSSYAIAGMPPRKLFEWAAKMGAAVALNVYRDRSSPLYVLVRAPTVQTLAQGRVPAQGA